MCTSKKKSVADHRLNLHVVYQSELKNMYVATSIGWFYGCCVQTSRNIVK